MMKMLVPVIALLYALLLSTAAGAETVIVYTSANFAPLVLGDGRGLYPDLVARLNRKKPGGLTFKLSYLPRKRLQVKLEEGSLDGIVIGMMPEWFDDTARKKYLWTAPFSHDRFVLVSNSDWPISPRVPATLAGATIGVTVGYVYPGIDNWLAKQRAVRSDGMSDEINMEKLLLGRVDGAIVAESMARYFVRSHKLAGKVQMAEMPGPVTERRFLVPRTQAAVYQKIAPEIRKLKDDAAWQKVAASYN
jgi:polar amino acid transport system substrate-binding protein